MKCKCCGGELCFRCSQHLTGEEMYRGQHTCDNCIYNAVVEKLTVNTEES